MTVTRATNLTAGTTRYTNNMSEWADWLALHVVARGSISFRWVIKCNVCGTETRAAEWHGKKHPCRSGYCQECDTRVMSPSSIRACNYCKVRPDCITWGRATLIRIGEPV